MYRGFFCGCKWSYFTPSLFLSHNLPRFIKGDAGGKLRVCVSLLLPAHWLLCVWLPRFPQVGPPVFYLSNPKLSHQEQF